MAKSTIQWCDYTWNVARGCKKVDKDCMFCYMYRDSMNNTRYTANDVVRTKGVFKLPLNIPNGERSQVRPLSAPLVFTSSLTDFFIEEIDSYRHEAWGIIRQRQDLIFLIVTKRPERIVQHLPADWGEDGWKNVWFGTSVGHMDGIQRMIDLAMVPAHKRFLSLEPLHGELDLTAAMVKVRDTYFHVLPAYDWVIVGGESGNDNGKYRYRPCELSWMEKIVKVCKDNQIPVFVKQMGTYLSKQLNMKDRHGGDISEFPLSLQVRDFPYGD